MCIDTYINMNKDLDFIENDDDSNNEIQKTNVLIV